MSLCRPQNSSLDQLLKKLPGFLGEMHTVNNVKVNRFSQGRFLLTKKKQHSFLGVLIEFSISGVVQQQGLARHGVVCERDEQRAAESQSAARTGAEETRHHRL